MQNKTILTKPAIIFLQFVIFHSRKEYGTKKPPLPGGFT